LTGSYRLAKPKETAPSTRWSPEIPRWGKKKIPDVDPCVEGAVCAKLNRKGYDANVWSTKELEVLQRRPRRGNPVAPANSHGLIELTEAIAASFPVFARVGSWRCKIRFFPPALPHSAIASRRHSVPAPAVPTTCRGCVLHHDGERWARESIRARS
jgi:hypothetical protein